MENFQIIQKLFKVFHQNHYINEQKKIKFGCLLFI